MTLQTILNRLQKLHPKEIDLSLDRVKNLCKKLGNPQKDLKYISVVGTNGKYSTIQALRAILKEANIKCNIYTSPHIQRINERFIFNDEEILDSDLSDLLVKVEEVNNGEEITYFEILTAAYFFHASKYRENINIIESGLFHRFDATNIIDKNILSIVTAIGLDHLDWLPKNEQTIEKIIFEKTSALLNSKIVVAKQSSENTQKLIKQSLSSNEAKKVMFNDNFSYLINENEFIYFEDEFGGIKLPQPNLKGQFQIDNSATAVAAARNLNLNITDENIKSGITKIKSIARLQEIKSGKLKNLCKNNQLFVDGSHNPLGAKVLNDYLQTLKCNKHIILGMMANKDHEEYMSYFKNISSLTTIDIPNQPNSIKGKDLKNKLDKFPNLNYEKSIEDALKKISTKKDDIILITGSLYLAGEVLNLN
ncbi:bifunctional folylpolyglutamate synthase/dihydrofolate synthase [Candidatus Pelagibacter sp. RS40]|uniref:bifunctional folylpolyglutamate synthase/dihydrofolate synthase n=1 Tax=Candidatus Pelagibacter sp. RS40 TaxID=1977865 RepID=UPI000A1667CA|nr:Mur ligase family protein [Candidatus Pelagibacter sp. RS40]ARJ49187.1 bifunctional folylpolyglutamate synthase/dihydrofolate synthase [Candidatus Pelagibacter sp. RS40]